MQTGAFIQLILTLGGIASRMSSLVLELADVLQLIWGAVHRILLTLDVSLRTEIARLFSNSPVSIIAKVTPAHIVA
jgi:hypothetical protein